MQAWPHIDDYTMLISTVNPRGLIPLIQDHLGFHRGRVIDYSRQDPFTRKPILVDELIVSCDVPRLVPELWRVRKYTCTGIVLTSCCRQQALC